MTLKLGAPAASDDGSTAPLAVATSPAAPRWSYRQDLRDLYRAGRQPTRLVVPPRQFVAVLGSGDPDNNPWYGVTIAALYQAAYRIRFGARRAGIVDAPVMPLEGQWWCEDGTPFALQDRSGWQWRMMIPLAPQLASELGASVIEAALAPGHGHGQEGDVPVQHYRLDEGDSVQIMHRGPWVEESTTLAVLHRYLADNRLVGRGSHHEIYLGDPARTAPGRLRTILRQSVTTIGPTRS
jgi:hypothetical protein